MSKKTKTQNKKYRYDKEELRNKAKEDIETRDSGGAGKGILDLSGHDNVDFFKPVKDKRYKIDIVPYVITTNNHPKVKKGGIDYVMQVWVHGFVGPDENSIICPKKTFKKECPICQEREEMIASGDYDKKITDKLKPSERCIYNIIDLNNEDKGIQLFIVSGYLFHKELLEEAHVSGDEVICFADLEDGYSVKFRTSEGKAAGKTFVVYKSFDFKEREESYPDEILDDVFPLDRMIVVSDYDSIKNEFLGVQTDDDDEEQDADDVDQEEDEKEERKSKKSYREKSSKKEKDRSKKQKCPHGFRFGFDLDDHDECDEDCDVWELCRQEYDRKNKEYDEEEDN